MRTALMDFSPLGEAKYEIRHRSGAQAFDRRQTIYEGSSIVQVRRKHEIDTEESADTHLLSDVRNPEDRSPGVWSSGELGGILGRITADTRAGQLPCARRSPRRNAQADRASFHWRPDPARPSLECFRNRAAA